MGRMKFKWQEQRDIPYTLQLQVSYLTPLWQAIPRVTSSEHAETCSSFIWSFEFLANLPDAIKTSDAGWVRCSSYMERSIEKLDEKLTS